MKIYTKDPTKGHEVLVGEFDKASNTLTIIKDPKVHYMRVVQGYGIQADVYIKCIPRDLDIVIKTPDKTYRSNIKDWVEHGKTADYGHGPQRFLSLKYMQEK